MSDNDNRCIYLVFGESVEVEWPVVAYESEELAEQHCKLANEYSARLTAEVRSMPDRHNHRAERKILAGNPFDPFCISDETGGLFEHDRYNAGYFYDAIPLRKALPADSNDETGK